MRPCTTFFDNRRMQGGGVVAPSQQDIRAAKAEGSQWWAGQGKAGQASLGVMLLYEVCWAELLLYSSLLESCRVMRWADHNGTVHCSKSINPSATEAGPALRQPLTDPGKYSQSGKLNLDSRPLSLFGRKTPVWSRGAIGTGAESTKPKSVQRLNYVRLPCIDIFPFSLAYVTQFP